MGIMQGPYERAAGPDGVLAMTCYMDSTETDIWHGGLLSQALNWIAVGAVHAVPDATPDMLSNNHICIELAVGLARCWCSHPFVTGSQTTSILFIKVGHEVGKFSQSSSNPPAAL